MSTPYPIVAYHFEVRLGGDSTPAHSAFTEVTGLDVEREFEEIREHGEDGMVHQVPGRLRHGNLVLKRGMVGTSDPLFTWCRQALESDLGVAIETRTIVVSLLSPEGAPLITWNCSAAWPVKWSIAAFDSQQGQVAMETIEFAYHRVTRQYAS